MKYSANKKVLFIEVSLTIETASLGCNSSPNKSSQSSVPNWNHVGLMLLVFSGCVIQIMFLFEFPITVCSYKTLPGLLPCFCTSLKKKEKQLHTIKLSAQLYSHITGRGDKLHPGYYNQ
ncbi:hypothetical protein Droror1_Dr00012708 [Drosera rotundifolia]